MFLIFFPPQSSISPRYLAPFKFHAEHNATSTIDTVPSVPFLSVTLSGTLTAGLVNGWTVKGMTPSSFAFRFCSSCTKFLYTRVPQHCPRTSPVPRLLAASNPKTALRWGISYFLVATAWASYSVTGLKSLYTPFWCPRQVWLHLDEEYYGIFNKPFILVINRLEVQNVLWKGLPSCKHLRDSLNIGSSLCSSFDQCVNHSYDSSQKTFWQRQTWVLVKKLPDKHLCRRQHSLSHANLTLLESLNPDCCYRSKHNRAVSIIPQHASRSRSQISWNCTLCSLVRSHFSGLVEALFLIVNPKALPIH